MLTLLSFRSLPTRAKTNHHIKATMRATLVALLAVAAVTSQLASAAAAAEGEGIVHVLTNDNFNAATAEGDWLVKFYAVRWRTLASWGVVRVSHTPSYSRGAATASTSRPFMRRLPRLWLER